MKRSKRKAKIKARRETERAEAEKDKVKARREAERALEARVLRGFEDPMVQKPTVGMRESFGELHIIVDDVWIATFERPDPMQAKAWISRVPGWAVFEDDKGIAVTYLGVRVH